MNGKKLKGIWEECKLAGPITDMLEIQWRAILDELFDKSWQNKSMHDVIKLVRDDMPMPSKVIAILGHMGYPKAA